MEFQTFFYFSSYFNAVFFLNDHLSGLLMDHRKYGYFISKSFYFSFNFDAVFSINWLPRELPVVCWRISSISYGFRDKPNQCSFKQNDHIDVLLMDQKKNLLFYYKKRSKRDQNSEISHVWMAYLELEIVKQDKCPKDNGSSILLCPAIYHVKTNSLSTLLFYHTLVQLALVGMLWSYFACTV